MVTTSLIVRIEPKAGSEAELAAWSARDDNTSIEVWQPSTDELLTFPVAYERALDAFHHPFAHLPTAFDPVPALGT